MKKAGFILSLLALIFSVIPFLNYAGIVMAFIGLPFGIVGIVKDSKAGESKKKSLTTIIMAGIAIVVSIIMMSVYAMLIFGVAKGALSNYGGY